MTHWPIAVQSMTATETLVAFRPGVATLVAILAIGGLIWCIVGIIDAIAVRVGLDTWE